MINIKVKNGGCLEKDSYDTELKLLLKTLVNITHQTTIFYLEH